MILCNDYSSITLYNIFPDIHFLSSNGKILLFTYNAEMGMSEIINFYTFFIKNLLFIKNVANNAVDLLEQLHLYLLN